MSLFAFASQVFFSLSKVACSLINRWRIAMAFNSRMLEWGSMMATSSIPRPIICWIVFVLRCLWSDIRLCTINIFQQLYTLFKNTFLNYFFFGLLHTFIYFFIKRFLKFINLLRCLKLFRSITPFFCQC